MSNIISVTTNKHWDKKSKPFFTILTPVYNRPVLLERALNSATRQTFENFEHIIIDDGSTVSIDSVVNSYMNSTDRPVMFIKKENGGVHTARNAGIIRARGIFCFFLDSDNEMLPNALQLLEDVWNSIPDISKQQYYRICGLNVYPNGKIVTKPFPDNINSLSDKKQKRILKRHKGENSNIRLSLILKENLWPEPEGLNFVTEDVIWKKVNPLYKTFYTNNILEIYHTEGDDHLSGTSKKTMQQIKNNFWEFAYYMNNRKTYIDGYFSYIAICFKYCIFWHIMRQFNEPYRNICKIESLSGNICKALLWAPAFFCSKIYIAIRMH